jgi:integrase
MEFWTQEEFSKFIVTMMNKPVSYYGFQMLYWCGLRVGELLALTPSDFDFKKGTVSITKSYQRLGVSGTSGILISTTVSFCTLPVSLIVIFLSFASL